VPISNRSRRANNRAEAGHWKADFMLFRSYG